MKAGGWVVVVMVVAVGGCTTDDRGAKGQGSGQLPDQPVALTRRDPEPAGQNCAHGGTAVRVGLDRNGNGVLDDDEVAHTDFVCAPATAVLVRKDPLQPSLACPAGGLAVHTGIDDNGDGILEDPEIDQTTTVCSSTELWTGDFTYLDWQDPVKVAALQGAHVVTGSLSVVAPVTLPLLELVAGNLSAGGDARFPALRQVSGSAYLGIVGDVAPSLPVLDRIEGTLSIDGGGSGLVYASNLRAVVGDVVIGDVGYPPRASIAVSLPGLETIAGSLMLRNNLTELHLDHLSSVSGKINLMVRDDFDAGLTELTLPSLATVGGDISVQSFTQSLTTVALSSLHHVGGNLVFDLLPALMTVSMPSLMTIDGYVSFWSASALATLDFSSLELIGGGLKVSEASALTTLSVAHLSSVGASTFSGTPISIEIDGTALTSLNFSSLQSVDTIIEIGGNPMLGTIGLPVLTSAKELWFNEDSTLESLTAPKIKYLDSLYLSEPNLSTMNFGQLETVSSILSISGTGMSEVSGLGALRNVGYLFIRGCSQLHDLLGLSHLYAIFALWIDQNPALVSLDGLELVSELRSYLQITNNDALNSVAGLANVTHIHSAYLTWNLALTEVALTHLQTIDDSLVINHHSSLKSLSGLAALEHVGGYLQMIDDPNLSEDDIAAFNRQIGRL